MDQLTLRGLDADVERRIRQLASQEGISLNKAAVRLLRRGAGLRPEAGAAAGCIGHDLDAFIGTWSDAEADGMREREHAFEAIDEELWR